MKTNFPWPDCGKEFEEWYTKYHEERFSNAIRSTKFTIKEVAEAAWNAAILLKEREKTNT